METDSVITFGTVLIGNSADGFIRIAEELLGKYGINSIVYESVYSATGRLLRDGIRKLVIGRIEDLSVEGRRFFEKLGEKGHFCCCLAEGECVRKYLEKISVISTQAVVINEPLELKEVLAKVISGSLISKRIKNEEKSSSDFMKEEFITTKEEIEELLGSDKGT